MQPPNRPCRAGRLRDRASTDLRHAAPEAQFAESLKSRLALTCLAPLLLSCMWPRPASREALQLPGPSLDGGGPVVAFSRP